MFFRSRGPRWTACSSILFFTTSYTVCEMQMPPGSASACRRAAMFTPSPITSWSCTMMSPIWMPMRCRRIFEASSSFASAANWRCIASAQATACTALENVISSPSPVVLSTAPSCSAQIRRISPKSRCRMRSVPTSSFCMRALNETASVKTMAARVRYEFVAEGRSAMGMPGAWVVVLRWQCWRSRALALTQPAPKTSLIPPPDWITPACPPASASARRILSYP